MQDPERYLRALQIEPPCTVYPKRKAILDSSLRIKMNHEIFYFSSKAARDLFLKNPLRYCGLLTDPVGKQRFQPTAQSPRATFRGRSYYFAADSSRTRFLGAPEKFADRGVGGTG